LYSSQSFDLHDVEADLDQFLEEISASTETNKKMLREIDEELLESAKNANAELISAAMDISKNGMGSDREAQLLKACERVESLMEISHSLIPYAEEESPWGDELEPEVDTTKPVSLLYVFIFFRVKKNSTPLSSFSD